MSAELVKRLRTKNTAHVDADIWMMDAANRIEALEAENALLGERNIELRQAGEEALSIVEADYAVSRKLIDILQRENEALRAAANQARLAFAGYVSVDSAVRKLDALAGHVG
jgi:hypothetical protein